MIMKRILLVLGIIFSSSSFGVLELNLNHGVDKKIPIGISFSSNDKITNTILNVCINDLNISKEFAVHEYKKHFARNLLLGNTNNFPENIDYMVAGEVSLDEDRIIAILLEALTFYYRRQWCNG